MANNNLGEIRRSSVITTSAPGAIADFRVGNASVSAVICGLDNWKDGHMSKISKSQTIYEERLQKKLGVKSFRLPPVVPDNYKNGRVSPALAARRFPCWLQCPICGRLAPTQQWEANAGSGARYCRYCTIGNKRAYVIPVRFVLACEHGHLDDFPWHAWLGHKKDCKYQEEPTYLKLTAKGAGLRGMKVECEKCGASKSMEGIFSNKYWKNYHIECRGKRPWLGDAEKCDCIPRTVQRGASNVYYPFVVSALSIPPWADDLTEKLADYWIGLANCTNNKALLQAYINNLESQEEEFKSLLASLGLDANGLADRIINKHMELENTDCDNLRPAEYKQFINPSGNFEHFETRAEVVPPTLTRHISHIARVTRLREVRALKGFTRIYPATSENDPGMAKLSSQSNLGWLPALEVRGEGIFVALNMETLREWESRKEICERLKDLENIPHLPKCANGDPNIGPTPRFILVHTLAHALLRQLTLECGYSTAALRERLYVDYGDNDMAGLLIYTSTTDTDGTLGGLQRQGKTNLLEQTLTKAIESLKWCSSDPLCIDGLMSSRENGSIGACHSCIIAPETSCEEFNNYLDRGLLLGWPTNPMAGYFSDLHKFS